jgi:hypothetical protein
VPNEIVANPLPIQIHYKSGVPVTTAMKDTKAALEELVKTYDLSDYFFTTIVEIDPEAGPRSHPVLTLSTRERREPKKLLATFLREQLHWHLKDCEKQTDQAVSHFRKMYSDIPVGEPDGAENSDENYLHLTNIWLEYQALKRYLGDDEAHALLNSPERYRWIYRKILEEDSRIGRVVIALQLNIEPDPERIGF